MVGDRNLRRIRQRVELSEVKSLHVAALARLLEAHDMMVKSERVRAIKDPQSSL
jgi:hypothetical protein